MPLARAELVYSPGVACDLYTPASLPAPGVVVVHGGGDTTGDKRDVAGACGKLTAAGYVAVAINYREMPNLYPAPVEDTLAAISWCRTQPEIDPARVAVVGFSFGGYLALCAATQGAGASRPEVAASWSAPTDFVVDATDQQKAATATRFLGVSYADDPALWQQASPALCVTTATCPCYLANADAEIVPLARALEMIDALARAGVGYELQVVAGSLHATQYAAQTTATTLAFLARWL